MGKFFVEETEEEKAARDDTLPKSYNISSWKLANSCTSCQGSISHDVTSGTPHFHPLLNTLICQKCKKFYGDPAAFSTEEDGSDKYCRWCGQGGSLYSCSKCPRAFCKKCIKRNVSRSDQGEAEKDDWKCFCCNTKPIWELRAAAWFVRKHTEKASNKKKKSYAESSDEDYLPFNRKPKKLSGRTDSTPTLKHVNAAVRFFHTFIDKNAQLSEKYQEQVNEVGSKMRRSVEDRASAEEVCDDLTKLTERLVSRLTESTKDLQEKMDQWSLSWASKLKEEKEMEEKGEIVEGRLIKKKQKKKGSKKLAATAGGGDSTDEGNSEGETSGNENVSANRSPKKRYLAKSSVKKIKSSAKAGKKFKRDEGDDNDNDEGSAQGEDDEENDEDEVVVNGKKQEQTPRGNSRSNKKLLTSSSKNNRKADESDDESDSENVGSKSTLKKGRKSLSKRKMDDSEDDEEEEEEEGESDTSRKRQKFSKQRK